MVLAFLLFAFLATSTGTPLTENPVNSTNIETDEFSPVHVLSRELPECLKLGRYRTTSQIIWSCVATIFACTWVAIHPNLPGTRDSGFQRFRRRVTIAIIMIIAPELIAFFAARQWDSAKAIKKEFNEKFNGGDDPDLSFSETIRSCFTGPFYATKEWFMGSPDEAKRKWTITHGFFVQMGGFMMYRNGKPVQVLTFDRLIEAIKRGEIDVPHIPEEDITDKSKGDGLSKLVVVLQTTWFVAQCLGRWISDLPVTELEVSTLAFAVLNAIIYGFWWSKPQGVLVPIKLEFTAHSSPSNSGTVFSGRPELYRSPTPSQFSLFQPTPSSSVSQPTSTTLSDAESTRFLVPSGDCQCEKSAEPFIEEEFDKGSSHWIRRKFETLPIHSTSSFKRIWEIILSFPTAFWLIAQHSFRVALKTVDNQDSKTASTDSLRRFRVGRSRVPMFYVGDKYGNDSSTIFGFFLIIPPIFGGIHLTLWSAPFYNPLERLLWRISALYITVSALLLLVTPLLGFLLKLSSNTFMKNIHHYLFIGLGLGILTTCLYPVARGVLIFISLHTLAHLPEGAYYEVRWANLLPHV